jgi:hypothetical protein
MLFRAGSAAGRQRSGDPACRTGSLSTMSLNPFGRPQPYLLTAGPTVVDRQPQAEHYVERSRTREPPAVRVAVVAATRLVLLACSRPVPGSHLAP